MVIKKEYLVVLNSRNRVQQTLLQLNQNPFTKAYTIERTNNQWGGKGNSTTYSDYYLW